MNKSVVRSDEPDSGESRPSNTGLYDHSRHHATVAGQHKGDFIVQVGDEFYLLSVDMPDTSGKKVSVFAKIEVLGLVKNNNEDSLRITSFKLVSEGGVLFPRILLLANIDRDRSSVDVIGCGARSPLTVPLSSCENLSVHNFVKVYVQLISKSYLREVKGDRIVYTADEKQAYFFEHQRRLREAEQEKTLYYYEDDGESNPEDDFHLHVCTIAPLDAAEYEFVRTSGKAMPELTALEAQLYIRDPWVARCYLEEHVNIQKALRQTIETKISWKLSESDKKIFITIPLDKTSRWLTIKDQFGCWFVGSGLTMVHPLLKSPDKTIKDNKILMSIQKIDDTKEPTIVTAVIDATSRDIFLVVLNSGICMESHLCKVGPQAQSDYSVACVIEKRFNTFFSGKFFKVWLYGLQSFESEEKIDYRLPRRNMDDDQLGALRTAVDYMGYSCLTGPPGSGKTHVACNLVKACNRTLKTNFAVSAHTNSAVNDIMSSEELSGLKICRELSKRATNTSTKEALKVNVYDMSRTPEVYLSTDEYPKVFEALNQCISARENLKIPELPKKPTGKGVALKYSSKEVPDVYTLKDGLHRLYVFRLAEKRLRTVFLRSYKPEALGATPVIMSRRLNEGIERLIIDEATLMTPFESLALYCTMPHLKSVILLGDPVRHLIHVDNILLGDSQAATFMKHSSEFSRVTSLRKTKELLSMKLKTVYCTHPELVKHFFHPLYFSDFKSVWGLQDKLNQVKIMQNLKRPKKGTKGSDIRVICQNKAQAGFVQDLLKGDHGQFGSLELPCSVGTIWAMQGQKSKVVILLTTKVQKLWSVSRTSLLALWFSRAQNYLYVVGNFRVLCGERTGRWNTFIQLLYNHDALVDHELRVIDTIEDNRWYHGPNIGEKPTVIGRGLKMDVFQYSDFVR